MENFEHINLPQEIILSLKQMAITQPTEIQKQTIPLAMQGFDVLASSQTGSGKTMAYLLPLISALTDPSAGALILVPTRELAVQVNDNLNNLTRNLKISSVLLIGGEPITKQFHKLKSSPRVVIGTPGRIIDHLTKKTLKLSNVKVLVLDEMDRMLDMGMNEQLEQIDKYVPEQKQVLMFSATIPKRIIEISRRYSANPKHIVVGSSTKAAEQIKQETLKVSEKGKFTELTKQLESRSGSVIVFVKTKRGAESLAKTLRAEEHMAEAIHGDLKQGKRSHVIRLFRQNKYRIMVATDVAARGLDIPHTQHVINYDLPMCPEDYLHRIGRTGRAGAEGFALSFISPEDGARWKAIDRLINQGESTNARAAFQPRKNDRGFKNKQQAFSQEHKRGFGQKDKRDIGRGNFNNNSEHQRRSSKSRSSQLFY